MVQSAPVQHHTRLTFRSIYSMRRAKLHYRKGAVFPLPCSRTQRQKQPIDRLARDQFGRSSKKSLCSAGCTPRNKKTAACKKQNNKRDQSEWLPQHTEQRGPDCLLKWSQSISCPSPNHGVANEPCDRMSTTHRDKRAWTNHRNDRLDRQTGPNEPMGERR